MSLYMQTTKIDALKTMGEIERLLVAAGASGIAKDINPTTRRPTAMYFKIAVGDGVDAPFRLPARVDPVFRFLQKQRSPATRFKKEQDDYEQAERVAWRQILRWVQAQLALIETGMVDAQEVFLPYLHVGQDQTLYDVAKVNGFQKLLPSDSEASR